MKIEKQVNTLWNQLQRVIDASSYDGEFLHDYRESSWHDALGKLLAIAIEGERGHRRFVGHSYPVSAPIGAKVILLSNFADGAKLKTMPAATLWLSIRRDAAEAMTLGYLLRGDLTAEWLAAAESLDYAEIMNPKEAA